MAYNQML